LAKSCSVEGCNGKHNARGFCNKHYYKWKKYGNPLYVLDPEEIRKKISERQKEWHKLNVNPMKGKHHTDETKKKISELAKGRIVSEETRKKMSIVHKNPSEATRKKISEAGKGRKFSEEHKMKISKANRGKKRSEASRKKMSKYFFRKGQAPWNKDRTGVYSKEHLRQMSESRIGQIPWNIGVKQTEEHRKKNSETHKGKKASDETRRKLSLINSTPERKQLQRETRARQKFPTQDSKPELLIQSILKKHKISFKKHHSFKLSESNHQADILIKPNYIIEIFGDYWHFNPNQYDGESIQKVRRKEIKVKEVWKYDKYVIDGMKKQGYKVLVIWESELKNELEKTTMRILKFINHSQPASAKKLIMNLDFSL